MTDNGAAMLAAETLQGLEDLGILHETTLAESPYQNGKQESFWTQVEGRLLAMLEGVEELTLELLNEATQAWVELEYNKKRHQELGVAPVRRYLDGPDVGSPLPEQRCIARRLSPRPVAQPTPQRRYAEHRGHALRGAVAIPSPPAPAAALRALGPRSHRHRRPAHRRISSPRSTRSTNNAMPMDAADAWRRCPTLLSRPAAEPSGADRAACSRS